MYTTRPTPQTAHPTPNLSRRWKHWRRNTRRKTTESFRTDGHGHINDYRPEGNYVQGCEEITHCAFDAHILVGKHHDGWLLFEFESRECKSFGTKQDVMSEAVKRGFDQEREILSVEEQFRRFANYR